MLNLTEIADRIKQPGLCGTNDIDSLKTLCETYPYSQIFPLLYLKTLAQTNDVRLDSELQKFAYRISDRSVLFDLLNNSSRIKEGMQEDQDALTANEEYVTEKNLEIKEEVVEENTLTVSPPLTPPQGGEQSQSEDINLVNESVPLLEEGSGEVTNSKIETETFQEDLPSLPNDILQSIGTEVYSLEAEEAKIAAQKENQEKLKKEALEQEKQKLIAALAPKRPINERSFTSWLKHNVAHVEQKEEKPDPEALIHRFIQNDPKISSQKEKLFEDRTDRNELFNPTKKAKESLDESQLPVSETLAKIFAAQGNYPKAIFAYQQLMLIFPEKKVFFASQIEELNKKLNT